MLFLIRALKNTFNKQGFLILLLAPLISSCSSGNNQIVEIINPPKFPDDFSSIPNETDDPQLNELSSAEDIIKTIRFGRKDPFLPPHVNDDQLLVPDTFKYHGQIASKDVINAFVSYENRSGIIKPGDIGGKTTDLLPNYWIMESLDIDKQVLTLSFENSYLEIKLFDNN